MIAEAWPGQLEASILLTSAIFASADGPGHVVRSLGKLFSALQTPLPTTILPFAVVETILRLQAQSPSTFYVQKLALHCYTTCTRQKPTPSCTQVVSRRGSSAERRLYSHPLVKVLADALMDDRSRNTRRSLLCIGILIYIFLFTIMCRKRSRWQHSHEGRNSNSSNHDVPAPRPRVGRSADF